MIEGETRLRLRYGLNEADSWWHFARGPHRGRIQARLRELRPDIVRIFLFDKGTPDPVEEWPAFVHPSRPEFLLTLPHVHGTSGFFVARLRSSP